jgi:hypothetical protein
MFGCGCKSDSNVTLNNLMIVGSADNMKGKIIKTVVLYPMKKMEKCFLIFPALKIKVQN